VNSFGPKLTQTKVELAGANLSPLTGSGTLIGLAVDNPKGWTQAGPSISARSTWTWSRSRLRRPRGHQRIIIDQPEFTYETKIVASNIKDLLKNIEEFTGAAASPRRPRRASRSVCREEIPADQRQGHARRRRDRAAGAVAAHQPRQPWRRGGRNHRRPAGRRTHEGCAQQHRFRTANALMQVNGTSGAATLEKTRSGQEGQRHIKDLFKKKP